MRNTADSNVNVFAPDFLKEMEEQKAKAAEAPKCPFCGGEGHSRPSLCPKVKRIIYNEDGTTKEVYPE
jgi:hypothetical protein